ncbi:hypothetical protein M9194_01480 [Vibrio sp. S4M6]|uniref:hypothetical protein n=1 Tax=Vibrio sinus TaxID=2946865 RepID=UPI00202A2C4B|nr:hypothetical protein [Vibrio sinus]MCL9780100.1 hypothetical protein [Vibrio sinus]
MSEKDRLAVGDHVKPQADVFGLISETVPVMDVMFIDDDGGVAECQYYDQYQQKHSHILLISGLEKINQD